MDIKSLNNVSEAYGANFVNDVNATSNAANTDNGIKVSEQKAQERKNTDSFSSSGVELSISDNSREAASANGRIVLASEDGIVIEKDKTATETPVQQSFTGEKSVSEEAIADAAEKVISTESISSEAIKEANQDKEMITDLTGFTSNQVETLYREGRVSKNDYDQKMEEIAELTETIENNQEAVEEVSEQVNQVNIQSTEKANTDSENKNVEEEKTNKAKEEIQNTIENNRAQSEKFGEMLKTEEEEAVKTEAYDIASENNREEIIDPLFNEEAKQQAVVVSNM